MAELPDFARTLDALSVASHCLPVAAAPVTVCSSPPASSRSISAALLCHRLRQEHCQDPVDTDAAQGSSVCAGRVCLADYRYPYAHAETEITAGLVRDLLRDQHPDLADRPLSLGARGWTTSCGGSAATSPSAADHAKQTLGSQARDEREGMIDLYLDRPGRSLRADLARTRAQPHRRARARPSAPSLTVEPNMQSQRDTRLQSAHSRTHTWGAVLATLDRLVVNVAFRSIGRSLHGDISSLSWGSVVRHRGMAHLAARDD